MSDLALLLPSPLDEDIDLEAAGDHYYHFGQEQVRNAIERFEARRAEENVPRTRMGRNPGWLARTLRRRLALGRSHRSKKEDSPNFAGAIRWHPAQVLLALGIIAHLLRPSKTDWAIMGGTIATLALTHIHFLF